MSRNFAHERLGIKHFVFIIFVFMIIISFNSCSKNQLKHSLPVSKIQFKSYNANDFSDILEKKYIANHSMITGDLYFPKEGIPPFPAVIILHGRSGWGKFSFRSHLASELNRQGIAAFLVDSYTGRGYRTHSDFSKFTLASASLDALEAYNALAGTKKINMKKVGIMGFSFGGNVAMNIIDERLQTIVLGSHNKFAAHAPVYNGCGVRWKSPKPSKSPMRFFIGEKDDYTPLAECEDYIARLQNAGASISIMSYPDSYHGWVTDYPAKYEKNFKVYSQCKLEIGDDGIIRDTKSSLSSEMGYEQLLKAMFETECAKRGAHIGRNEKMRDKFAIDVANFFSETLK